MRGNSEWYSAQTKSDFKNQFKQLGSRGAITFQNLHDLYLWCGTGFFMNWAWNFGLVFFFALGAHYLVMDLAQIWKTKMGCMQILLQKLDKSASCQDWWGPKIFNLNSDIFIFSSISSAWVLRMGESSWHLYPWQWDHNKPAILWVSRGGNLVRSYAHAAAKNESHARHA